MSCDILVQNFQLSSCDKTSEPGLGLEQKAENWDLTQSCHQGWASDPGPPGGGHHHAGHIGHPCPAWLTYTQLIPGKNP